MHPTPGSWGQAEFFLFFFFLLLFGSKGTCKQPFCAIGTAGKARPIEWKRRWEQSSIKRRRACVRACVRGQEGRMKDGGIIG